MNHCWLQFVPDDLKDDKYWARRRKNNMAAKRSRDARRMKENQIALRAGFLEKEVSLPTPLKLKNTHLNDCLVLPSYWWNPADVNLRRTESSAGFTFALD